MRLTAETLLFYFALCFLSPASGPLSAASPAEEEAAISLKSELNRSVITIGDPVEYTVTVRHSPDLQIISQVPPPAQESLKLKKVEDIKRTEDKKIVEGRRFILTAFKLGQFILDPIQIQYRSSGGKIETLTTDPLYLTVKSVAQGEEKKDIRGIKSVLQFPGGPLALLGIMFVSVMILAFFIYLRLRKRSGKGGGEPEVLLSFEEEAIAKLNRLFDSDLIRRGKVKEYYLKLSEILRAYFEKRFKILAVESTTYEILRAVVQKEIDASLRQKIEEVLSAADLAKFAKWVPEPPQIISLNQKSRQIIEEAKPRAVIPNGV